MTERQQQGYSLAFGAQTMCRASLWSFEDFTKVSSSPPVLPMHNGWSLVVSDGLSARWLATAAAAAAMPFPGVTGTWRQCHKLAKPGLTVSCCTYVRMQTIQFSPGLIRFEWELHATVFNPVRSADTPLHSSWMVYSDWCLMVEVYSTTTRNGKWDSVNLFEFLLDCWGKVSYKYMYVKTKKCSLTFSSWLPHKINPLQHQTFIHPGIFLHSHKNIVFSDVEWPLSFNYYQARQNFSFCCHSQSSSEVSLLTSSSATTIPLAPLVAITWLGTTSKKRSVSSIFPNTLKLNSSLTLLMCL